MNYGRVFYQSGQFMTNDIDTFNLDTNVSYLLVFGLVFTDCSVMLNLIEVTN